MLSIPLVLLSPPSLRRRPLPPGRWKQGPNPPLVLLSFLRLLQGGIADVVHQPFSGLDHPVADDLSRVADIAVSFFSPCSEMAVDGDGYCDPYILHLSSLLSGFILLA